MILLDKSVWVKTIKVIVQAVLISILISVLILVLASTGQQSVYRNLNIDRNAYMDMLNHVLGR